MFSFNKEQEREIRKQYKKVIKDMKQLFNKANLTELEVHLRHGPTPIELSYSNYGGNMISRPWIISFEENGLITLFAEDYFNGTKDRSTSFVMSGPVRTDFDKYPKTFIPVAYVFIMNYEKNRKKIIAAIDKESNKSKTVDESLCESSKLLDRLRDNEVHVELSLPESTDQRQIDIHQEGEKTVGIFDFGGKIVKIITSNDIVLVRNNDQKQKVKNLSR